MADGTEALRVYHRGDISGPNSYGQSVADPLFFNPSLYEKDYDILSSFNFSLRIEGAIDVPIKTIRGITKNNEYEYIQEGGLNDYVHMVRKQVSQPFQFQVERYVSQDLVEDFIDPMANGTEFSLPLFLNIFRGSLGTKLIPSRIYAFNNARVTGVQIGDLDAEKSGLHTVTTTIAYSQLLTVSLPLPTDNILNIYKFNKDNIPNNEPKHARTLKDLGLERGELRPEDAHSTREDILREIDQRVRTKADMMALANENKYDFQGKAKGQKMPIPAPTKNVVQPNDQLSKEEMGERSVLFDYKTKEEQSAVKPSKEQISKEDMEEKAKKYPTARSARAVEEFLGKK